MRRKALSIAELADMMLADEALAAIGYNEMAGRVCANGVLPWDGGARGRPWGPIDDSRGLAYVQEAFGECSERDFQHALNIVADERRYNPVVSMLDLLPAWDGERRTGYLMQLFLGAEQSSYVEQVERLFMRAALARTYKPGCKFDYMPVLVGSQGIGKSSFLRALAMREEFFTDSVSGIGTKQAAELVQGKWVVEIAELAAMRGTAVESVKAFITRQSDDYRAPYARHAESRPRRFVVAGTTNTQGFLTDPSGNRRFLPVLCGVSQPLASLFERGVERHFAQAWVEALADFRAGWPRSAENLVLPAGVMPSARDLQEQSTATDGRIGIIEAYLERFEVGEIVCVVQIVEEALGCPRERQSRREQMEISELMHSHFPDWRPLRNKRRIEAFGVQRAFEKVSNPGEESTES